MCTGLSPLISFYLFPVGTSYHAGLKMVHVPWAESPRRKYVNPNEVKEGLNLINVLSLAHDIVSVLVIMPVRKQSVVTNTNVIGTYLCPH